MPASTAERAVLTVSDLNRQARMTIEERFSMVWVMGEMSNFARPRSGHWYFSLKDQNAQVRCAMFANRNRSVRMQPGEGQLVIVRGRVSLYEGRGDFQIIVDHMEPAGEGALRQAFDQLKVKLATEGLFEQSRKADLPAFPQHCTVITSPTGAAIKDVLAVWQRRYPSLQVTLIPTAVQGADAEPQILRAIEKAQTLEPDVILLTRGGGSLEDLWSFNLESIARALAQCPYPTVCAVGHEIDVTICDFVADVRAPTPSAAAELIAPDRQAITHQFNQHLRHLSQAWAQQIQFRQLSLANLAQRVISPRSVVEQASQRIDDVNNRMLLAMHNELQVKRMTLHAAARQLRAVGPTEQLKRMHSQLGQLASRLRTGAQHTLQRRQDLLSNISRMLHSVSPLPTISRGYALVTDEQNNVVSSIEQLQPDQRIRAYFADGSATATIDTIDPDTQLENQ